MGENGMDQEHRKRERAYYIWEREGRPEGRATAHWLEAEAAIAEDDAKTEAALDEALRDSFPDSDPPAMTDPVVVGRVKRDKRAKT